MSWVLFLQVVIIGMSAIARDWGIAKIEICDKLMPTYLMGGPNSEIVLERISKTQPEMILMGLIVMLDRREGSELQVLRLSDRFGIELELLASLPLPHALDLASQGVAAGVESLDQASLESWLTSQLTQMPTAIQAYSLLLSHNNASTHRQKIISIYAS